MAAPKKHISLLPKRGFETTAAGRAVVWSLNTGRVIVIITELIVIIAFLSRFWLDRTLTDLNDQIKERVALIKTSQNFEREFKTTQTKLAAFTTLAKSTPDAGALLEQILNTVPPEIALIQLSFDPNGIQVRGTSLSEAGLEGFINSLDTLKIGEVVLTRVSIDPEEAVGINFIISILKEKEQEQKTK